LAAARHLCFTRESERSGGRVRSVCRESVGHELGSEECDLHLDDPPVVTRISDDQWVEQCAQVSEFAVQTFFHSLHFSAPNGFYGVAKESCLARIEAAFPALPLPPYLFYGEEFRLFGFEDLVVNVDPTWHVSVAAQSECSLEDGRRVVAQNDFLVIE